MGKIFYLMGKSSSGKDTIYKQLMADKDLHLKNIVLYTTRPIRQGEQEGIEYHFITEEQLANLEKEGRIHVIRPDRDISAKPVERDPAHLKEIYEVGRRVMKADMEKLKAYLAE